jgi:hypothetical protein
MKFPSARRRYRRRQRAVLASDESEERLVGYDLTKIKHEFSAISDKEPCRVCAQPKYSWPHLAREITNPESFDFSRDDEKY